MQIREARRFLLCMWISNPYRKGFCRKSIDNRGDGGAEDWGVWLLAPARRGIGQSGSKWLREEGDAEWTAKIGRANSIPYVSDENQGRKDKVQSGRSNYRTDSGENQNKLIMINNRLYDGPRIGPSTYLDLSDRLGEDEDVGLEIEDKKRRRSGSTSRSTMDVEGVLQSTESKEGDKSKQVTVFSETDYTATENKNLAKLALQARQSL